MPNKLDRSILSIQGTNAKNFFTSYIEIGLKSFVRGRLFQPILIFA